MLTVGEFAIFLQAAASRARDDLNAEVKELLGEAVTEAASMIGHEVEEWAPLSSATMNGFFLAGKNIYIPGKIELGYTGHVSDTDPLLRTGALRKSIESESEKTAVGVEGVIASQDRVALYQEMGTVGEHPIPPRPFLAPSMQSVQPRAEKAIGEMTVALLTPGIIR